MRSGALGAAACFDFHRRKLPMRKMCGRYLGLVALVILGVPASGSAGQEEKEQVFYNGKIFTAEPEHPYAEAVALRGDKIIAVGTRAEATKAAGKNATATDLL